MAKLLNYIFCRIYNSYKNNYGLKADRITFASAIVGFLLAFNVVTVFCIPLILFKSTSLLAVYVFAGVSTAFLTVGYFRMGERYKKILKEVDEYPTESKSKLKRNSTLYIIVTLVLFVWVWYHTIAAYFTNW